MSAKMLLDSRKMTPNKIINVASRLMGDQNSNKLKKDQEHEFRSFFIGILREVKGILNSQPLSRNERAQRDLKKMNDYLRRKLSFKQRLQRNLKKANEYLLSTTPKQ